MTEVDLVEEQALDPMSRHDAREARIERGLATFIQTAVDLMAIRDEKSYRLKGYKTFEQYCRERWGFSDSRARQLMGAAETVTVVTVLGLPAPQNEGQARELGRVPEAQRGEVWQKVVTETDGKPTAKAIREAATPPPARIDPFQVDDRAATVRLAQEPLTPEEVARIEKSRAEYEASEPDREELRQQRVATDLLDSHVNPLALLADSHNLGKYRTALSSRPITREKLDRAEEAIRNIRKALIEEGQI